MVFGAIGNECGPLSVTSISRLGEAAEKVGPQNMGLVRIAGLLTIGRLRYPWSEGQATVRLDDRWRQLLFHHRVKG